MDEIEKLCDQLIEFSQRAFDQRIYEAAFHTIHAALHCAFVIHDEQRLRQLETMAREQSAWIDEHDPTSILATRVSEDSPGSNLYSALIRQASAKAKIVRHAEERDKHPDFLPPDVASKESHSPQPMPDEAGGADSAVGDL